MKRYLLAAGGALLFIALLSAYVVLSVASDLRAVKATLDSDTRSLEASDVAEAEARLLSARDRLEGLPARMLRFVPVVGQNIGSLRDVVAASIPTLQAGLGLNEALEELDRSGLVDDGRIDIGAIRRLEEPVSIQVATLLQLDETITQRRNGWLVPPLWDAMDSLSERTGELLDDARGVSDLLGVADELLGADSPRRYLVLLINNAELRGAGGILSGVGHLTLRNGKLRLGEFTSVHSLRDQPPEPVEVPEDFERFKTYKAHTTLWLNTTFSPDASDVAVVASRLYEKKTGIETDGAVTIDPRGVEALLPPDTEIPFPNTDVVLAKEATADFIYSDAYRMFSDQPTRRRAILDLGKVAFEEAIGAGLGGEEGLRALSGALAGEHIRFDSFRPKEHEILAELEVTGDLASEAGSAPLMVTTQNFGGGNGQGSKLDFWARRTIEQTCIVSGGTDPRCTTRISIKNTAPDDLNVYVAGRDGTIRNYLEAYVPAAAEVESVRLDGEAAEFRREEQGEMSAVGLYIEVPREERREVEIAYSIPGGDGPFQLSVMPQPLARDARVKVEISMPGSWVASGAGEEIDGVLTFEGALDRTLDFAVMPDPRTGISGIWSSLKNFWNEPLF